MSVGMSKGFMCLGGTEVAVKKLLQTARAPENMKIANDRLLQVWEA